MFDLIVHLFKRYNSAQKDPNKRWELPRELIAVTDETSNGTWDQFTAEMRMVSGDIVICRFNYNTTRSNPTHCWTEPYGPFWMCETYRKKHSAYSFQTKDV